MTWAETSNRKIALGKRWISECGCRDLLDASPTHIRGSASKQTEHIRSSEANPAASRAQNLTIEELLDRWCVISAELARLDYPPSPEFRFHLRRYIAFEKKLMARSTESEADLYRHVSLDKTVDLDTDNPDAVLFRRAAKAIGVPLPEAEGA